MTPLIDIVLGFTALTPVADAATALANATGAYNTALAGFVANPNFTSVSVIGVTTVLYVNTAETGFNCTIYGLIQYTRVP